MDKNKITAILSAFFAALFYSINMPFSKLFLEKIEPTYMASFLYFGAGTGIGIIYLFSRSRQKKIEEKLTKKELPYTLGMIALDIAAPIFLMVGLTSATSANASLLNNFEIVATSVIALFVFKEVISPRLWVAIALITLSSMLLSFEDMSSLRFSYGSAFILAAAVCWGFENNCTKKISSKSTFQIV
jgi:drug/metabolite transporter (DMT)-like permease